MKITSFYFNFDLRGITLLGLKTSYIQRDSTYITRNNYASLDMSSPKFITRSIFPNYDEHLVKKSQALSKIILFLGLGFISTDLGFIAGMSNV